jgi:hypothetical protein
MSAGAFLFNPYAFMPPALRTVNRISSAHQPLSAGAFLCPRNICTCARRKPTFTDVYMIQPRRPFLMLRSYEHESSPSHQNWELKRASAPSVLGRVIPWEPGVP